MKKNECKTGYQVRARFLITLHQKDRALLELIRLSLGVGIIFTGSNDLLQLQVASVKELQVIINHFDSYPLITQK